MAYPSNKFPATAKFGSTGTITQPTDAYLLKGFVDEEPIPAEYLNHIVAYADAEEARLGNLFFKDQTIEAWEDSASSPAPIYVKARGGLYLRSTADPGPAGSFVTLESVNGAATAFVGCDCDSGTSEAFMQADSIEITAENPAEKVLTWTGTNSAARAHKGLIADPDGTNDRHYAFQTYRSVNLSVSPKDGGWTYVALVAGGTGDDKQTYIGGMYSLVGESALSGGECSWRRSLHEVDNSSRSTSGIWYCESVTARFNQDNSVAFTLDLIRVDRSTAAETSLGTITVASGAPGTSSPQTVTINTMLNLQLYTYRLQIVATDSYTSAKRLGQFTVNMRKYGAD